MYGDCLSDQISGLNRSRHDEDGMMVWGCALLPSRWARNPVRCHNYEQYASRNSSARSFGELFKEPPPAEIVNKSRVTLFRASADRASCVLQHLLALSARGKSSGVLPTRAIHAAIRRVDLARERPDAISRLSSLFWIKISRVRVALSQDPALGLVIFGWCSVTVRCGYWCFDRTNEIFCVVRFLSRVSVQL